MRPVDWLAQPDAPSESAVSLAARAAALAAELRFGNEEELAVELQAGLHYATLYTCT